MPDFQPIRFGKYILLERLATGGMAQLYKAKITGIQGFEKLIAIKMILPHLAKEKEFVTAFIDEAKLAALLNHQNIVQIYDFGSMEDSFFISMEYLFGNDLRAIWVRAREKNLPISLEYALYIVARVCAGLGYAHELKDFQGNSLNIIHRDISPQNIFVTYQGEVKILDFGIAKAASQSTVTQCGMIKGKVAYMSPEQAAGRAIDQRSDIFSTGIVLYELIAHSKMFDGDSTIQILTKVRDADYRPLQDIVAGLPPKVYAILDRALAKNPDERYPSCSEMGSDLEECIVELGLRPTARGLSQYMRTLFDTVAPEDQGGKEASGGHRRGSGEIKAEMVPQAPSKEAAAIELPKPTPQENSVLKKAGPLPEKVAQAQAGKDFEPSSKRARPQDEGSGTRKPQDRNHKKEWMKYAAAAAAVLVIMAAIVVWQKVKTTALPGSDRVTSIRPSPGDTSDGPPATAPSTSTQVDAKEAGQAGQAKIKAQELLEQAMQIADSDPQKARSALTEAIHLDPQNVQAYVKLGLIYVKLKDYPQAIECYSKAADLDPHFPDIYFNLGFAYGMNADYARAEEMYQKVVNMKPPYLDEALFNLAVIQDKQGKRAECLTTLEQAYAMNPGNEVVRKYLERIKGSAKKKK
jgi:serine/threonine protein kinase/Tfp pilus assembly protein PilF